jgi:hypothetical protein
MSICLGLNAQTDNSKTATLLGHEKSFLDLVTKDTVHDMSVHLELNVFTFGIPSKIFNDIAFIKRKNRITLQPMGTGRVYELSKDKKGDYLLNRIDSTVHSGVNFNAFTFHMHDTLFQLGGNGFWNIRGILTYFSKRTRQWELLTSNIRLPIYKPEEIVLLFKADEQAGKIYISNSMKFENFPTSLASTVVDSCYEYNFISNYWHTLGALNPILRKKLINGIDLNFSNEKYNIFTRELDFYWVNFSVNKYGKLMDNKSDEIKQEWINFYPASELTTNFQFSMGDSLYLIKVNNNSLEYRSIALTEADFYLKNADYIFIKEKYSTGVILSAAKDYGVFVLIILFIGILIILITKKIRNKNTAPVEVMTILYNNFYNSLSIIEKELILVLLEYQQKGAELNTKIINKIIGVQQKDTLTQNKSRSDHFIKINQKFSIATQHKTPLIMKNRDQQDKRQFNYTLNLEYIVAIEKLLQAK